MLAANDAVATVAVTDLDRAREFYGDTLGLKESSEDGMEDMVATFHSGASTLLLYKSEYAGTNQATSVTWEVDNVANEVETLKKKGVAFQHYDFPDARLEGDVHVFGDRVHNAWFKDPDGNILAIVSVY